jgi:hypothetical protein
LSCPYYEPTTPTPPQGLSITHIFFGFRGLNTDILRLLVFSIVLGSVPFVVKMKTQTQNKRARLLPWSRVYNLNVDERILLIAFSKVKID